MNMGYENQPRNSLAPLVVVFLVLGSMMFAGLVVTAVFGGWFFLRKSSIRPMEFEGHQAVQVEKTVRAAAEEAAEAARAQAEQAREMAAQLKKQVADENVPVRQIRIELDQDGVMKLNGDAIVSPGASKPASNGRFKTSQFHVNVVD
jgi:preprotein translocase subunit SecF